MNEQQKRPGITCPECNFFIDISIPQLLRQDDFLCPGCGLVLSLMRPESRDSMEALSHLQAAIENVESVKKTYS